MAGPFDLPPGFKVVEENINPNKGLPPGFEVQETFPRQPGPEEPYNLRRSVLGNYFSGLGPAIGNMISESVQVPIRTAIGIGDAYDEVRNAPNKPNKLSSAIASPLVSYLNASTRNVPEAEKNAAKARVISSTVGGVGGATVGSAAGPWGAFAGGVGGAIAGDRYGRESLQAAGLEPEQDQWEEDKQDIANLGIGATAGGAANRIKSFSGNRAGRNVLTDTERMEQIYRGTNPGSLQAQALGNAAKDFVIRPPRTGAPDPLNRSNAPIDVAATAELQTPSNNVLQITKDYENTLRLEGEAPLTEIGMDERIALPERSLAAPLDSELPTTGNQPNVAGETTSGATPTNPTIDINNRQLPTQRNRGSQYYLDQALNEAGMQDVMAYRRTGQGSEFDTISQHVVGRQLEAKNRNREILSSIPPERYPTVGDTLFNGFDEMLNEGGVPQAEKRPYYDVLYDEVGGLAPRILGWQDADPRTQDFRMLINRQKSSERGGGRTLDNGEPRSRLSVEEQGRLDNYLQEIQAAPMPVDLMDELKSRFSELAGYDKKSGRLSTDDRANRSHGYELIANNLRDRLESVVYEAAPDNFENYRRDNRQIQILKRVEDLAKKRAAEESQFGRNKELDDFGKAGESPGLLGRAVDKLKNVFIPNPQSREAKLRQADRTPFNRGTGATMFGIPEWTNRFYNLDRGISRGIEGYQDATTSQFSNNPLRPQKSGIEGLQGGRAAVREKHTGIDVIDNKLAPALDSRVQDLYSIGPREPVPTATPTSTSGLGKLSSVLGAVNPFQASTAMAEEMPEKLPRNSQDFNQDQLANFLMQTTSSPKAPIAQQLVAKLQEATMAQDVDKAERLHADMTRIFPELFEQGTGVNGKVFYPDEQVKVMENLRQLHRQGQVDSIHLAKQRNAFMNPMDSRILPVTPKKPAQSYGPNKVINGTRQYAY